MRCERHSDREAVSQCKECGAGVCHTCAEATKGVKNRLGTLCIDCYRNVMAEYREYCEEEKRAKKKHLTNSLILYIVGIILVVGGISGGDQGVGMLMFGLLFCGFYTGISGWKLGIFTSNSWLKLFIFALFTVAGIVATPIWCIVDIKKMREAEAEIQHANAQLARVDKI